MVDENPFKKFIAALYAFSVIVQLFAYSFGGQIIKDKSSSVAENFYLIDKDFAIIIARTQRATVIKAAFYEATLPSFLSVLSSASSLITLLQSFID